MMESYQLGAYKEQTRAIYDDGPDKRVCVLQVVGLEKRMRHQKYTSKFHCTRCYLLLLLSYRSFAAFRPHFEILDPACVQLVGFKQ